MGDGVGLLVMLVVAAFVLWLAIILPAQMATRRGRSAIIWVCISIVGSPLLATLLLAALGDAAERPQQ